VCVEVSNPPSIATQSRDNTTKKNTEALIDACKEAGLEVHAELTKYTIISRHQNTGKTIKY
jgi:hypothetical protein